MGKRSGSSLRYDPPPEKRRKHGAIGEEATIERDDNGKLVGRCAGTIDDAIAQRLLESGVRWQGRFRRKKWPEKIFNVFKGVPYCGHGPGGGRYWGFPIGPSEIPPDVLADLRERVRQSGDSERFELWIERQRELNHG